MVKAKRFSNHGRVMLAGMAAALTLGYLMSPVTAFAAGNKDKETEADTEEAVTEAEAANTDTSDLEGVILSTDYPGVTVKPGSSATFTLYTTNDSDQQYDLELSAPDLPKGWTGYFRGSDGEVSAIHVGAQQLKADSAKLSYVLNVPEDAKEGVYELNLQGKGSDAAAASAHLTVKVSAQETAQSTFTAEYPEQQGASGTNFSFSTTVSNNSGSDASYALSAQAPEGWTVTFTPSGESSQVASLPVTAGSSQGVTVAVTPTQDVEKGDYDVKLIAASSDETMEQDLKVTITGTYGMTLSTPTGALSADAYNGEASKVTLVVTNTGNVDLNNIQLTGTASTDWTVEFDQSTIDTLEAGGEANVTATITPAKNAIIGDYLTQISAKSAETSADAQLRISVKNHTTWGFAAIGVIVVLIVLLGAIIRKFGRR